MTWSLSSDDDGLEPVTPRAVDPPRRTMPGLPPPPPPRKSSEPPQTVVVDPNCQVPPHAVHELAEYRHHEPTVILQQRRVDGLRKTVIARRRAHRRRSVKTLLLWGVSGALAVLLGALATSLAFAPARSDATNERASSSTQELTQPSVSETSLRKELQLSTTLGAAAQGSEPSPGTSGIGPRVRGAIDGRERAADPAESPLLQSGLEPEALREDEPSPFEESGLVTLEDLAIAEDSEEPGEASPAPSAPPVTLEELMRE